MAQLGMTGPHDPVRVRRVNPPEAERALLRTGQQAAPRMDTPPGLLTALKRKLGVLPPVEPSPATLAAALAAQHSASAPAPVPQTPARPVAVRNTTPMPAPRPPAVRAAQGARDDGSCHAQACASPEAQG
jgi:rare lipoprotein A